MKTLKKTYLSICCLMLLIMQQVYAQPGSNDSSFNVADKLSGFDRRVNKVVIQPDGKILIGGDFDNYNGEIYNKILRLNSDGTLDKSFKIGEGFSGEVFSMALQTDGKILVGGVFRYFNGTESNLLVRLNSDGTLDKNFKTGSGFSDESLIWSIFVQKDGKIIVGGSFKSYNGVSKNHIIRLNIDGTVDSGFKIGNGLGGDWPRLASIGLQSDGKIIIGGEFTSINGNQANNIARLNTDGTFDFGFNIGAGFSEIVSSILVQSDDRIRC